MPRPPVRPSYAWVVAGISALFLVACGLAPSAAEAAAPAAPPAAAATAQVEFNRDIRPILSDKCFFCHGPDPKHREADLRLDLRDAATAEHDGHRAIAPGDVSKSELIARITSTDADMLMPPAESNKKLSPAEIELLKRWIAQGAEYQSHWAYAPIAKPTAPKAGDAWARNDVDRYLAARLDRENLKPAAEADPRTLIRRVHLDLTGLPPTPEEVEAFTKQADREQAYEAIVDKLLASPAYAERMTAWWLDLVRYADTVGYHGDQDVSVWPYRDYVIQAFQSDLPFDQFTLEQLAGDLLPGSTRAQKVASGYNRLGMMTAEGGAQDKEYLAKYSAERVRNASGVWLGATMGCCECHDHKFDPYTARDFYSFASFFADLNEKGFYGGAHADGKWGPRILLSTPEQEAKLAAFSSDIQAIQKEVDAATPDAKKQLAVWEKENSGEAAAKLKEAPADVVAALKNPSAKRNAQLSEKIFTFFLQSTEPKLAERTAKLKKLQAERTQFEASIPSTLVTEAVAPREIRVLARGNWMDQTGEIVTPAVPAFLPQPAAQSADKSSRLTRADLARWITSPDNPLTPRVFANRLWAMLFGVGISKRLDDLGAQGEPPINPELLDYLAADFRDGRSFKRTIKLIVMSSAYRQSSVGSKESHERDPYNRLSARQGRFRLPAETIRDSALAASGLLSKTIGGRSCRPYQPAGYYSQLNFPKREYQEDTGENLWRRSVYTHWQRTFLHPAMVAFDAPSREECTCERVRSATPLQSLVLLNDPEFVEAARALAERTLRETKGGPAAADARLTFLFRMALQRDPTAEERKVLAGLYERHRADFTADSKASAELLDVGARPVPGDLDAGNLAAWTSVARAVLNTHEFVNRD
jgi:hypothetical protein